MISRIRKFFAPSTAKALKGFNKAVDQLDKVVALEDDQSARLGAEIDRLTDDRLAAMNRRDHARRLSDKFREFVA